MNTIELNLFEASIWKMQFKQLCTRYQVIYLHLQGYKNVEITKIVSFITQTIGTHIRNYKRYGLEGLISRPKLRCPKKISLTQEALLIDIVINKTLSDVGLEHFMTWVCKLLCISVKREFYTSYSKTGMRDILSRLGFSYMGPTYSLARLS